MQESYSDLARGVLAVMPRTTLVTEFRDYFINLNELSTPTENPWLADWYMTQYNCKLQGVTYLPYSGYADCANQTKNQRRNDFRQNANVDRTIMAIFAYAKALKKAQQDKCGSVSGLCQSLQQMTTRDFHQYLKDVDFRFDTPDNVASLNGKRVAFDANGDFISEDFTIWNYNDKSSAFHFQEVGRFENGQLALSSSEIRLYQNDRTSQLTPLPTSMCPIVGCGYCVIPRDAVEFMYVPGDVVIGGVLSGHLKGKGPISCGDLSKQGMSEAVAMYYAIQTAKSKYPGILNGVNLGAIMADSCESPQTGAMLYNNILAELQVVRDKLGRIVDPNAIRLILDFFSSSDTIQFNDGVKTFNIQELGISATSSTLSDRSKYPNYARVVPSDDKLAIAMTQFFAKNGWNFIQTINSPSEYGRSALADLRKVSASGGVCIGASHEISADNTISEILTKTREQSQAKVVVLFLDQSDKLDFLQSLKAAAWPKDYVFVGSDDWYSQLFNGYQEYAPGFISIEQQHFSLSGFEAWLNTLKPRQASAIPGFSEWYEGVFNCYIDAENRGKYTTECGTTSITSATGYIPYMSLSYTINAVYLSAIALDQVLKSVCGSNYNGVCSQFRSSATVSDRIRDVFRNVSMTTDLGSTFKVLDMEGKQGFDIFNYQSSSFVQVGKFDTEQGRLSDQFNIAIQYPPGINSGTFKSMCEGRCTQCSYVQNPGSYAHVNGDVEIGGIIGIHDVSQSDPYVCGDLQTVNGFQFAAAMMYAVEQVNSKMSPVDLRDVKLGSVILDHCNVESRRFDILSAFYAGLLPVKEDDHIDVSKVRAWVTDNTRSVIEVNEVVKPLNVPLISPIATSNSLMNRDNYPSFFRTIQGDVTLSVAMAKLAKALNFHYVTVLYSDDEYGLGGLETFTAVANQEKVCIKSLYKIGSDTNMTNVLQSVVASTVHVVVLWTNGKHTMSFYQEKADNSDNNMVVIAPMPFMPIAQSLGANGGKSFFLNIKTTVLDKYMDYIRSLPETSAITTNPFVMEYYMKVLGCDLPHFYKYGVQCSNIQTVAAWSAAITQDNYVIPTMNAVYSFATALDVTLKEKCGTEYRTVCNNFITMDNVNTIIMEKMETTAFKDPSDFTFKYMDREGNTGMDLIYFDGSVLKTVGEFAGASLQISDDSIVSLFSSSLSYCIQPCTECLQTQLEFSYIPGDILIGGVFDVHERDVTTFSCGNIKTLHGFQLLEAFHYAITKVNDKSGPFGSILKNIKLGGIGLDACDSTIKSGYTVSDIHNGIMKLNKNGETIDPDDISAYIAGYSSDSSLYLARILKSLKIPQISYGSTSIALSDQDKYPYFMRSVPSDDNQAESMIKFLDNFDIRYVQIVYSPTNYGRLGLKAFENLARDRKICIGQMIQFPDNGTATRESSNEVVSALLKKPTANTVVLFAATGYINALFQAIRRNPSAKDKYYFLGTETWGNNLDILSGVEDLAKNAVTWSLESTDIGDFDTYLGSKSPGNYPQNPWFPQFYEDMVDCYLTVPDGRHPVQCASLSEVVISQRNYIQDQGIIHVINSVYAAAIGVDSALKSVCGEDYSTVCEKFRNDANRRDILMKNILRSNFTDPTGSEFSFTDKRDGNRGYQMYSLSTRMEGVKLAYYYKKIGTYSSNKVLSISNYATSWDGSCNRPDACSECPTLRYTTQRYMYSQSANTNDANAATLVAVLPIHAQGTDPYRCGSLNMEDFYRGLSFFFAIRQLTNSPFGLHGVLLDTCTNSLRIDQDLYNLLSSGQLCNAQSDFGDYIINNSTVGGVITTISTNVMAANRVLAPLKIPLVGSMSSSVALSNKEEYPYFARTVPPDNSQMKVIADILKQRNWTYVSVVYSRETYGVSGANELEKQARLKGVCIGLSAGITYPTDNTESKSVVEQLIALQGANVVILITLEPRPILLAAKELGVLDKFVWIGSEIWGTSQSVVEGIEHQLMGAITIGLRQTSVTGFDTYLTDLTYTNRKNIPDDWFEEFYQTFHKCQLSDAQVVMSQYPLCTKMEVITKDKLNIGDKFIYTTVAATYAAANAIQQTKNMQCSSLSSFRECFEKTENWDVLFQKLLQTQYQLATNFTLTFNSDRFWDVGYTINNYVMDSTGNHFYREIGSVVGDGTVTIASYVSSHGNSFSSQCPPGGFCNCDSSIFNLPQRQTSSNETVQEQLPRNYLYYDKTPLPNGQTEYKLHFNWPIWAIATAVPTCVGLFVGIFIFVYFLLAYPVRGGTTLLGFMMIVGVIGIYGVNFAFFLPASETTCGARRFMMGVVYAIVFAAMLVKAIDNWRFDGTDFDVQKYTGVTSTCSLFMFALGLLSIQLIIPIEWVILEHPSASLQSDSLINDWMWCDPVDRYDYALILSMIFVMFLVLLTAIFAAFAWDSESNCYESRWIFVSCICTAGCFLVWMVVSTNAGPPYRDPAVAIGNFVNATALLICLPIRKLVLLFYFQRQEEKDSMRLDESVRDRGDNYSQLYSNPGFEHDMYQPELRSPGSDIGF